MVQSTTGSADEAAAQLRRERDRFVGFAFAGGELLIEVDGRGRIRYVAGAAKRLTGTGIQDLIGLPISALVTAPEREGLRLKLIQLMREGRLEPSVMTLAGREGEHRVWLAGHRPEGQPPALQLSLRRTSNADEATSLPDRAEFERYVVDRLADGESSERLTLLDLRALDQLRDQLDPDRFDALRAEVGSLVRNVASEPNAAGWLGGDALGLVHGADLDAEAIKEQIRPVLAGATTGATVDLDASGLNANDAVQALRYAINRFVSTKGDDFSIHSLGESLDAMVTETVARVAEYRGTVRADGFDLAFQPIVDLKSRKIHHYELLARFGDGRSPTEMVTFAEEVGMVAELDLSVCRRALELVEERAAGGIPLAINLSGHSLESELFSRALFQLLKDHQSARGRLLFEVTETAAIHDPERVGKILTELRRLGLPVCLDDFGSGAAAFHYLRAFRVDYVKIDGDYIKSTDQRDQAILRGMVWLCHELGIKTIAEMIETPLQVERLRRMKVDLGQGYLFGRPGPLSTAATAPRPRGR